MRTLTHLVVLLIAVSLAPGVSFAQRSDQVGKIQFANSCSSAVQEKLLRGIAMLHSFYYSATQKAFRGGRRGGRFLRDRRLGLSPRS